LEAFAFALSHRDILSLILTYAVQELVIPAYWIFTSWSAGHHKRIFYAVWKIQGLDPKQVSPLSEADRQELQRLTQQYQQKRQQWDQKKQQLQQEHPILGWAVWVFKPPGPRSSKAETIVKRVVTTPFKSVLPFVFVLFGLASSHTSARDAMQPYFELKGIKSQAEQDALVDKQRIAFSQFGLVVLVLRCIPLLGMLMAFFMTVAAALWAADIEKSRKSLVHDDLAPHTSGFKGDHSVAATKPQSAPPPTRKQA
jgi:hypothetical protein